MTLVIGFGEKARALRAVSRAIQAEKKSTAAIIRAAGAGFERRHAMITAHHEQVEPGVGDAIKRAEALGVGENDLNRVRQGRRLVFVR